MRTLAKYVVHGLALVGGLQLLKEFQNRKHENELDRQIDDVLLNKVAN